MKPTRQKTLLRPLIFWGLGMALLGPTPLLAHGGEVHADDKPAVAQPAGWQRPAKRFTKTVRGKNGAWRLLLTVTPGQPLPGETVDLTLTAQQELAQADPLLGGAAPLAAKRLGVLASGQRLVLKSADEAGVFTGHAKAPAWGPMALTALLPQGQRAAFAVPVLSPPLDRRAEGLRRLFLGAWVLMTLGSLVLGLKHARPTRALLQAATLSVFTGGALVGAWRVATTYFLPPYDENWVLAQASKTPATAAPATPPAAPALSQAAVTGLGVVTRVLRPVATPQLLLAQGLVDTPPGASHEVSAPVEGVLSLKGTFSLGQRVRRGQVLATVQQVLETTAAADLNVAQFEATRALAENDRANLELSGQRLAQQTEVTRLEAELAFAQADLSRTQALYDLQAVARREVEEKRLAAQTLQTALVGARAQLAGLAAAPAPRLSRPAPFRPKVFTLTAPVSGVLTQVDAVSGEMAAPGKTLFTVLDDHTAWVGAQVAEQDLPRLRPGMVARLVALSAPGRVLGARLKVVDPVINPDTRTARVWFVLANPGGVLRPGGAATVEIPLPGAGPDLFVPEEAVIPTDTGPVVYVRRSGGFAPAPVRLGAATARGLPVLKGLEAGQTIVVRGAELLRVQEK